MARYFHTLLSFPARGGVVAWLVKLDFKPTRRHPELDSGSKKCHFNGDLE
jgi:hypothetical protein